jgi:FixJ family two-component response regulator
MAEVRDLVVFIVDDDDAVRDSLSVLLRTDYADVREFSSGRQFLAEVDPASNGCLLLDINLPEMSGFDLMERMKAAGYRLPTILITGQGGKASRARAAELGAIALLDKPIEYSILIEALDRGRAALSSRV